MSPLSVPRGRIFLPEEKNLENSAVRRSHRDPCTTQWNPKKPEGKEH